MALFDFRDLLDRGVEGGQRLFSGVRKLHLGEGDVFAADLRHVEDGLEAENVAVVDQPLEAHLTRALRQTDAAGKFGDRHAAVFFQNGYNPAVMPVELVFRMG